MALGLTLTLILSACGGGGGDDDGAAAGPAEALASPTAPAVPAALASARPSSGGSAMATGANALASPGRLLASNCFQCHGTGGTGGFENIRGGEADEVREYRNLAKEPARRDIMAAHAQGYTDAQIALIIQNLKAK